MESSAGLRRAVCRHGLDWRGLWHNCCTGLRIVKRLLMVPHRWGLPCMEDSTVFGESMWMSSKAAGYHVNGPSQLIQPWSSDHVYTSAGNQTHSYFRQILWALLVEQWLHHHWDAISSWWSPSKGASPWSCTRVASLACHQLVAGS